MIRIDLTTIWDAHNLTATDYFANDGGLLELGHRGRRGPDRFLDVAGPCRIIPPYDSGLDPTSYLNFIRDPDHPFVANPSTLKVFNYASFTNNGAGVKWIPFDTLWD